LQNSIKNNIIKPKKTNPLLHMQSLEKKSPIELVIIFNLILSPSPTALPEQLKITKLRKGLSNLVSKNYWVETGPELLNQNIHGLAVPHPLIPSVV
jgi:hypothetical protein